MSPLLLVALILLAAAVSLLFSTLTHSLRDLSRGRLTEVLRRRGREGDAGALMEASGEMGFVTAALRLGSNLLILVLTIAAFDLTAIRPMWRYVEAVAIAGLITLFTSVAMPHALARHGGEQIVAATAPLLWMLRWMLAPLAKVMHAMDNLVGRAAGGTEQTPEDDIEQEIMSIVEEGEKEGVVDDRERRMIESVISFHGTTTGQIMTARTEIVGLEKSATLEEIVRVVESSGHSRLPVYQGNLDHIVGILYARDLLRHVGRSAEAFDIATAMRPPLYVPETKPLRDLLQDFRLQKVHLAIVQDEYGGTGGLVTIEDTLEELVGEISDEHEPAEPAMFRRVADGVAEADARIYIDEINRLMGLRLPDDVGYDTLGGFISNLLGRIGEKGTTFEHQGARYTILEAEPRKVNRVRIEMGTRS